MCLKWQKKIMINETKVNTNTRAPYRCSPNRLAVINTYVVCVCHVWIQIKRPVVKTHNLRILWCKGIHYYFKDKAQTVRSLYAFSSVGERTMHAFGLSKVLCQCFIWKRRCRGAIWFQKGFAWFLFFLYIYLFFQVFYLFFFNFYYFLVLAW